MRFWTDSKARNAPADISSFGRRVLPYFRISDHPIGIASPVSYAGLGDKDETFRWLEKAYQERSNQVVWLAADPWWYPMYSDPRFQDLIRRVGLPRPE
jgi:hypothetical protein